MSFITDLLVWISAFIIQVITSLGYFGILLTMALESAALPIPSEIIMPFAGFIVFQGGFSFWLVVAVGTIGNLLGSLILYYIGLKGGRPLLLRYGRYALISEKEVKRAESWFERHGTKMIFFSRMLPVARTFISLPAGAARMDLRKFALYTTLGSIPWNFALTYIGFIFGERWHEIEGFFKTLDIAVILGIAVIIVYLVVYLLARKTRKSR